MTLQSHSSLILVISIIDWFTALVTTSITTDGVSSWVVQQVYLFASSCIFNLILVDYMSSKIVSLHISSVLNGLESTLIFTGVIHCDNPLVTIKFVKFRICGDFTFSTW